MRSKEVRHAVPRPDTLDAKVVEHPVSFRKSRDESLSALVVEAANRMVDLSQAERPRSRGVNSST